MQYKKTVQIPATEQEVVDRTTCDICGTDMPPQSVGDYRIATVRLVEGTTYPECGRGRKTTYDCCPECWSAKIVPLFGDAKPRVTEWDY